MRFSSNQCMQTKRSGLVPVAVMTTLTCNGDAAGRVDMFHTDLLILCIYQI